MQSQPQTNTNPLPLMGCMILSLTAFGILPALIPSLLPNKNISTILNNLGWAAASGMSLAVAIQNKHSLSAGISAGSIFGLALGSGLLSAVLEKAALPGLPPVLGFMGGVIGAVVFHYRSAGVPEPRTFSR